MTRTPYYSDDAVTLYHGNAREIDAWLAADVLVTDPPYGIGWKRHGGGVNKARGDYHAGISNDNDTSVRDAALELWDGRPAAVFGSFYAPQPGAIKHVLVYQKPPDAGVLGSTTGWRRDLEPIYLTGRWPHRFARWGSLLRTNARAGGTTSSAGRTGHPHAKPLDLMESLVDCCPDGVIADPFAGSGSTLIAARNLGRRAIGVELDERYCELIAKRLAQDVLPLEVA